jgi:hypothetical protein
MESLLLINDPVLNGLTLHSNYQMKVKIRFWKEINGLLEHFIIDITIAVIVNESFENKRTFDKTGTIDYMK